MHDIFVKKKYDIFDCEVRFQYGVARLCTQLLSDFSIIQFKTLRRYYNHIEDVHVTCCTQIYNFGTITAIFTFRMQI